MSMALSMEGKKVEHFLMLILGCSSNGCILRPRGLIAMGLLL